MNGPTLFAAYIKINQRFGQITPEHIASGLNYRTVVPVEMWLVGESLPPVSMLPQLAKVLDADPVEVAVGWLIANCPELEGDLQDRVLKPLGLIFPRRFPAPG